ncbi:hypothetical protein STRATTON_232 [Erwinia phage vB_EamM_Stratton]|uniref:Uncharacterized protein n=1 Tax=Erwinia phage vB_EamM_Stratton TaxID=1883378 RepID=A0A1B2IHB3_9CAUD|nr:hypothetical protein STRATTON_232 [Erwinia phage vB_EamM_Stratton]
MYALLMLDDWFQHQTTNKKAAKIAYFVMGKVISELRWDHSSFFEQLLRGLCHDFDNWDYSIKRSLLFDAWWEVSEENESWFKRDTEEASRIITKMLFDPSDPRQLRIHNRMYQMGENWLWATQEVAAALDSPVSLASYEDLQAHNLWFGGEEEEYGDAVVELYLYPEDEDWPALIAKYPTEDYVWLVRGVFWEPVLDVVCHKGVTILDRSVIVQQMIRDIGYDDGLQSVFARSSEMVRDLRDNIETGNSLSPDSGTDDQQHADDNQQS